MRHDHQFDFMSKKQLKYAPRLILKKINTTPKTINLKKNQHNNAVVG